MSTLDTQKLMEAFQAFSAASEQLQVRYTALQGQLGLLQGELQTVLESVPFAIWVLAEDGELRFSNGAAALEGAFLDGPAPWEKDAPQGLRRFQGDQGQERFFEEEHRPVEGGGRVVVLRDVTEQVLRSQQATREERLEAMGRMAAELAHEIRNPLGSLNLFAGMLVQDLKDQEGPLELAKKLNDNLQRLNRVVSNTLSFSRDLVPKPAGIDLKSFWEDALSSASLAEGAAWENRIPKKARWMADPDLLRQVAMNLLQNAWRATEGVAKPTITLRAVEEAVDGAAHWHLTLQDNGCGIPKADQTRVFDPFFSAFGGGTGLGLAVCHRIVVAHGGLLFLESEPGQGTTVHLRLRAA
jgi:signal transduction histidine kinase